VTSALTLNCKHRFESGFTLDVQLEADNRVTALCGNSGSGKTSILLLIAGLLEPDCGYIRLGDQVVTDTKARIFLRPEHRHVGVSFQHNFLFPHLRVHANIAYGMQRRSDRGIALDRIIKTLELTDVLNRYPRSLSGGEQQRVALARALASAPRILVLDEPLTAVEDSLSNRIATFIERIVDEFEVPTIVISHNRRLVKRLATRIILIENGRVLVEESEGDCIGRTPCRTGPHVEGAATKSLE
jgi:molybdate transport system ATP-binding protein